MVLYRKQKYINYAVNAIQKLKRDNGLTISEIVKYIMLTTEKTSRFRPLFAKVKASTNLGISNGLLTRHHYRIQLRSDDDMMSSRDGSDTSDGDSGSEDDEEDDRSSVGTMDNESGSSSDESERYPRRKTAPIKQANKGQLNSRARAGVNRRLVVASSNESKWQERRKTAPVKRVDKKQMKPRIRAELKRRLVEASSDDETEYDSDEDNNKKKQKVVQRKSRQNRTLNRKRALPPRSKSSPAKRRSDSGCSKASYVVPKNDKVKANVEGSSTRKQLPLARKISTTAQDAGKGGNKARKRKASTEADECGSDSRRKIKEEVGEDQQPVPGTSGTRDGRKGKWEVKKEKAEEGTKDQDGDGNEAGRSNVKVKVEKGEELKVSKDVEKAQEGYDFYT